MIKKDVDCSKYNGDIKSVTDLIYVDEYRTASEPVKTKADEMYENGSTVKEIIQFCNKEKLRKVAERLKKEANLSKRFITRTFENYKIETPIQKNAFEKAKKYVENIDQYIEDGTGIIFVGNGDVGTGKTHLACAIANELLDSGYPVKVINITKLIATIKENFKIEPFLKVPILLIDDLGKEVGTQWVCETLYAIFNERYEAMKPTIITTENGLEQIKNNYITTVNGQIIDRGKSIVSRLTSDFIYVPLTGEDYRQRRVA